MKEFDILEYLKDKIRVEDEALRLCHKYKKAVHHFQYHKQRSNCFEELYREIKGIIENEQSRSGASS